MGLLSIRTSQNCIIHLLSSIIIHYTISSTEETQQEDLATKEKRQLVIINQLAAFFWRSLADSNRCTRFCRPVTKPLIQATFRDFALQIYCCFLTCATLSAHFFAEFFSGFRHTSCNLHPAQAVSVVLRSFMALTIERAAANTAIATINPTRIHCTILYVILHVIKLYLVLKFFFTIVDRRPGVRSGGYSVNGSTVWQPFLYSLHP